MISTIYLRKINLIFISILLIFSTSNIYADYEWQEVECQFEIIDHDDKLKKGTVLDVMINQSGTSIDQLLEEDRKTIKQFTLKYKAPVKLQNDSMARVKDIWQLGFYRQLHPKIQARFKENEKIKIQYAIGNPILIRFIIDNEPIPAPFMLTDTIEDKWHKK